MKEARAWLMLAAIMLVSYGIGVAVGRPNQYNKGYRAGESAAYTAAFATLDNQAVKIKHLERQLEECRIKLGHRTAERPVKPVEGQPK